VTSPLVEVTSVWKAYPRWPAGSRTARAVLMRRLPAAVRRGDQHWALRDVSLAAARGESVGIIGSNGAGKSTLLRLAAGLGRPTRGRVALRGQAGAILSLGDSLDLRLTGRENALTLGLIAGLSGASARALVADALAFAELEDVADAPVRTYSEGMKLRLAFGTVVQVVPQVLLLDEVLAVGDLRFQARCLQRMRELREQGTTVLFASHDLGMVAAECERALWLDQGAVLARGSAGEVIEQYRAAQRARTLARTPATSRAPESADLRLRENRVGTQALTIDRVGVSSPGVTPEGEIATGEPVTIELDLTVHEGPIVDPIVSVTILRGSERQTCCVTTTHAAGVRLGRLASQSTVRLTFDRLDLVPGEHVLDVGVYSADWEDVYDFHWGAHRMFIGGPGPPEGVFRPPHRWELG
jgi:lipopolysaccharide transport system ATP-binding protein